MSCQDLARFWNRFQAKSCLAAHRSMHVLAVSCKIHTKYLGMNKVRSCKILTRILLYVLQRSCSILEQIHAKSCLDAHRSMHVLAISCQDSYQVSWHSTRPDHVSILPRIMPCILAWSCGARFLIMHVLAGSCQDACQVSWHERVCVL